MYSRWAEDPVAPDFVPSADTVVSSIAEDETIDIDSRSLESSELAFASRSPSALSGDKHYEGNSVVKEDLDKTFDLSVHGDEEEGEDSHHSNEHSSPSDGGAKCSAQQNDSPNTQATYSSEPTSQTLFALDITEFLEDEQVRTDNAYLESNYKDYRYCPLRLGGPRTPQIVLIVLALGAAALGVAGSVVPSVPSMPFVLLAAVFSFAFCLGSVTFLGRPVN